MTVLILAAVLLALAVPVLVFALVPGRPVPVAAPLESEGVVAAPSRAGGFRWVAPGAMARRLERSIALAGLTAEWPLARALRMKALLTLVALALGIGLLATGPDLGRGLIAAALVVAGYLGVDLVLSSRARERQERIQLELADALDQVTISIEAGLGLETAIARAGQYGSGPLAEELTRTVQDMRVGFSRREAWLALAARTDVVDLKRFARAIMQADQYGVSIGNVVRSQAKELRAKRRQRAEEKAMKVPVKILFPLMFCILPVLFIVVLGPGVINVRRVISGL